MRLQPVSSRAGLGEGSRAGETRRFPSRDPSPSTAPDDTLCFVLPLPVSVCLRRLTVQHAAVRGREVDAAEDAHVAGDRVDRAELVLVVVDPDPTPAGVVGAPETIRAADGSGDVDGR